MTDPAKITHTREEAAANAALITAAPELLTSLKAMLDAYWGEGDGHPPPQFIADAINAIAKAEAA